MDLYRQAMPVGTYRVQSAGFPKIVCYDKIYIVGDFNYPSVRWDGEWSNNKDNDFVECVRDVFLTQTVNKTN